MTSNIKNEEDIIVEIKEHFYGVRENIRSLFENGEIEPCEYIEMMTNVEIMERVALG